MFKTVLVLIGICVLLNAVSTQTTTKPTTKPTTTKTTTKPTTTTTQAVKAAVEDVASLKKSINTYFDKSYELLTNLGLATGQSQSDEYTSDFCLNKWKTYQVKEIFNLSTALKDYIDVYTFYFQYNFFAINGDNLFFFYEKNTAYGQPTLFELKTYNFRTNTFGASLLSFTLDPYQFVNSKGVSVDKNGNIYAAVVTGNGYKLQLYKFDSKAPFTLVKAVNVTLAKFLSFESISYDAVKSQFYLLPSNGAFMVVDDSLAIVSDSSFLFHYALYYHNGRYLVAADKYYIRKFNPVNMSMKSTKVLVPDFSYFNGIKLNNECMFTTYFDWSSLPSKLTVTMMHINGVDSYNVNYTMKYPSNYDTSLYTTVDSKIYHVLIDKSVNAVQLIKLDYAI